MSNLQESPGDSGNHSPRHAPRAKLGAPLVVTGLLIACGGDGTPSGVGAAPGSGGSGAGTAGAPATGGAGAGGAGGSDATSSVCSAVAGGPLGLADAHTPKIDRLGDGYVLTFVQNGEARVTTLDAEARITSEAALSEGAGDARLPSVHVAGNEMIGIWSEGNAVSSRRLDAAAVPFGDVATLSAEGSDEPRPDAASMGTGLAAVWMVQDASVAVTIEGMGVTASEVLGGWFPAIAVAEPNVALTWSAGGSGGPIEVAIRGSGVPPARIPGTAALIKTAVAGPDGAFFIAWEDVMQGEEAIGIASYEAGTGVRTNGIASPPEGSANWPALAWSGERLALAYYQFRSGAPSIHLQLLDRELSPLGEIEVATDARFPSVVWSGDVVAVAYERRGGRGVDVVLHSCP